MSETNSSIIKPSAGGTTILKDESGTTAFTIDASGDVQIANNLSQGTISSGVTVPQATTKHVYRYTAHNARFTGYGGQSATAGDIFMFGTFKPKDSVNNSLWIECSLPISGTGQDQTCCGIVFRKHGSSGSDVDLAGKGYSYNDMAQPNTALTTMSQYCGVAANTLSNGVTYSIWWRMATDNSNPTQYFPDSAKVGSVSQDARYGSPTEGSLVIYEYKNYQ